MKNLLVIFLFSFIATTVSSQEKGRYVYHKTFIHALEDSLNQKSRFHYGIIFGYDDFLSDVYEDDGFGDGNSMTLFVRRKSEGYDMFLTFLDARLGFGDLIESDDRRYHHTKYQKFEAGCGFEMYMVIKENSKLFYTARGNLGVIRTNSKTHETMKKVAVGGYWGLGLSAGVNVPVFNKKKRLEIAVDWSPMYTINNHSLEGIDSGVGDLNSIIGLSLGFGL